MRQFFLTYGTGTGPAADKQREVLKGLTYGGFRPADDSYLDPIREMEASETLSEARRSGDAATSFRIGAVGSFRHSRWAATQVSTARPTPCHRVLVGRRRGAC